MLQKRAPRFARAPEALESKALTERSLAVLGALARYRVLSTSQILAIVPGNTKVTHRHLQKLFHLGLVDRTPLVSKGSLGECCYLLRGQKPLHLLREGGLFSDEAVADLSKTVSAKRRHISANPGGTLFIQHELIVSRFHILIETACRESHGNVVLKEWKQGSETWNTVAVLEGEDERVLPHRPDAVFTLAESNAPEGQKLSHFLYEADRGTMTATKMLDKLKGHAAFLLQRKHTSAYGFKRVRAVLIESPTLERAEKISAWASQVCPDEPLFWITVSSLLHSPPHTVNVLERRVWTTATQSLLRLVAGTRDEL